MIGMPRALVDTATINLGLNIAVKKYLQGKKIYYTIFFALKRVSITFHLPSKWCRKTRATSSKILLLKSIIFSFKCWVSSHKISNYLLLQLSTWSKNWCNEINAHFGFKAKEISLEKMKNKEWIEKNDIP